MYHDLRMAQLHRHAYSFVESKVVGEVGYYLFQCNQCTKFGQPNKRLIRQSIFWKGREDNS